jgi:hypothetical protein
MEHSLPDHRHTLFTLRGQLPDLLFMNPKVTDRGSFRKKLNKVLTKRPVGSTDEAGLGLVLNLVQHALITN